MLNQTINYWQDQCTTLAHLNELLKVRLTAYEELSRIIHAEEDIETALNNTLDLILTLFKVPAGSILLLNRTKQIVDIFITRGDTSQVNPQSKPNRNAGFLKQIIDSGKPIMVNQIDGIEELCNKLNQQFIKQPKNVLCVPIRNKNDILGMIEIHDKAMGDFTEDEKNLLESIGNTLAIAVLNVSLFKLAHTTVNRLKTLIEVSKIINTTMNLQDLLDRIMSSARDVLSTEGSSLMLIDETSNELYFNVTTGTAKDKLKEVRIPFGKGIAGIVAETGEAIIVNDAQNDARVFKMADETTKMVTKNIIAVPMRVKSKVIGVLEVINSLDRDYFDDYDLELFQAFADHAGIAIFNRDLIHNLKKANQEIIRSFKEIKAMYEMSNRVTNETDPDRLFKVAVEVINFIFDISKVSIMLLDEKTDSLMIKEAMGINHNITKSIPLKKGSGISQYVFLNSQPVLMKNMDEEKQFGLNKRFRYKTKSFISVPLKLREKVIGVLNVTDRKDGLNFDEKDLITFMGLANQIGKSYENIIYYNQFLEKQRIEKELEITRDIQQNVLPKKFPELSNIEIGAINIPAKEVGGDFYDYIHVDNNRHGFLIADVSGKSLPASMFMAFSRSITRVEAFNLISPSKVLEESNKYIYKDSQAGMFVTMFYCVMDLKKSSIIFGSAGHNEQLLYQAKTGEFKPLKVKGIPLGVAPDSQYREEAFTYEKNDILILYTDGVTEAIDKNGAEFGLDQLKEIIKKNKNESAYVIMNYIMSAIDQFTQGLPQFDDITLLIIKFKA